MVQDNIIEELGAPNYHFLGYDTAKFLYEDNEVVGTGAGGQVASPKDTCSYWSLRKNVVTELNSQFCYLQGYGGTNGAMDICYNYIVRIAGVDGQIFNTTGTSLPNGIYRNTVVARFYIRANDGLCEHNFTKDVIINDDSGFIDRIRLADILDGPPEINYDNNVSEPVSNQNTTIDNVTGYLLESYLSANGITRGTRGHEVA